MATEKKYLDLTGLQHYDSKIKAWASANFNKYEYDDSALTGRVSNLETLTSDYSTVKSNAAAGKTAADAWTIFLADSTFPQSQTPKLKDLVTTNALTTELAKKVDKVEGMGLSQNSYTNDEKTKLAGIAPGAQVNVIESVTVNNTALTVTGKAVNIDLSSYDTIDRVNTELAKKADATSVYTKTEIDTKVGDINTEIAKKANSATTLEGYGITDAYTKTEVDNKISTINAAISGGTKFIGVINNSAALTEAGPDSGDIFVAGAEFTHSGLTFKKDIEYIFDGTNWYELGDSSANAQAISNLDANKADKATTLKGYGITDAYTKTEVEGIKTNLQTYADQAETDAITASKAYVDGLNISGTYATKDELTAGLGGKTSMSVGTDGVVFTQGSGESVITVSPITAAEIDELFA